MSKTEGPDIRQLRDEKLADGKFPGDAAQDFRVFIGPKVHEEIAKHAGDDAGVEVCGVLVGSVKRDENGPFVSVSASIRGDAAASKEAEVTFTHATWAKINERMDKVYRDLSIVGWYHTHPNFGIFLSDRDTFIHEHFFAGPGQIAYVVDPVRKLEGVFVWRDGKPTLQPYYSIGPRLYVSDDTEGSPRRDAEPKLAADGAAAAKRAPAAEPVSTAYLWTTQVLVLLCGLGIGALWSRTSQLSAVADATARLQAAVLKDTRTGLSDHLVTVEMLLAEARDNARALRDNTKPADEAKAQAVQNTWAVVLGATEQASQRVQLIRMAYGLNADEEAAIERAKTPPPPTTTRPATQPASTQP